jgi:hypothetical protein
MTKREKTMMEKVLEEAKEQGFEWYKDNASPLLSIDELLMQAEEEEWQESNDPATAEMTIADFDKEIGKAYIYKVDDRGYLRDRVAAIWKDQAIYTDEKTKYNSNPIIRLDVDKINDEQRRLLDYINRDHDFKNKITIAWLYLNRVFVAFEKQETDPFEVKPADKMKTAFENEDWKTLEKYAADLR